MDSSFQTVILGLYDFLISQRSVSRKSFCCTVEGPGRPKQ